MLRNYLKTAYRNLSRNKAYTGLNVLGLALGIGCSLVIFKVVRYELSFDSHQSNFENIYRVVKEDVQPDRIDYNQGTQHPLGPALAEEFPELEKVTRTYYAYGDQINVYDENGSFKKFLFEEGIAFLENSFFEVFDVEWIVGDPNTALSELQTIVITESSLEKLFGLKAEEADKAMGKLVNYNNKADFKIVGVIRDMPSTSNFQFTLLFQYYGLEKVSPYFGEGKNWNSTSSSTNTYFIAKDLDVASFENGLRSIVEKYHGESEVNKQLYHVQPLSEIHYSKTYNAYVGTVSKKSLYALVAIAIFLVLTACINFVNLATAQSANRAKEIGIRKSIGSLSIQLVIQFFTEIFVITFIAVVISLAIGELLFIYLEEVLGYRLSLIPFTDLPTILFLLALLVVVSFISGFYPSLLLSRMNPILALKNKITARNHSGGLSLRKGLVIFQFAISQFMIVGTLIISAQMNFFLNKDLGFSTEAIIQTYLPENDSLRRERFKNEVLNYASLTDITYSLAAPTGSNNSSSNFNYAPLNSEDDYNGSWKPVDERYLEFYGLELLAGRNIRKNDTMRNVIINKRIADLMGFQDNYDAAIGEKLTSGFMGGEVTVIGIVEDFHTRSLREDMTYTFLLNMPRAFYQTSFKTSENVSFDIAIKDFERAWESVFPEYVISWDFYDEELAERYRQERSTSILMQLFSIISIIIGCLGLYGLISFIAINRVKEIGVRKVLGASVFNILGLFSREVGLLLIVAFVFAMPAAFFLMRAWLTDFVYRIEITPMYFVLAFVLSLLIALITIGHRTVTSALLNPARILKDE